MELLESMKYSNDNTLVIAIWMHKEPSLTLSISTTQPLNIHYPISSIHYPISISSNHIQNPQLPTVKFPIGPPWVRSDPECPSETPIKHRYGIRPRWPHNAVMSDFHTRTEKNNCQGRYVLWWKIKKKNHLMISHHSNPFSNHLDHCPSIISSFLFSPSFPGSECSLRRISISLLTPASRRHPDMGRWGKLRWSWWSRCGSASV